MRKIELKVLSNGNMAPEGTEKDSQCKSSVQNQNIKLKLLTYISIDLSITVPVQTLCHQFEFE